RGLSSSTPPEAFKSSNIRLYETSDQQAGLITASIIVRLVRLYHVEYANSTSLEDEVETSAMTSNLPLATNSEELQLRRLNLEHQKIDLELQKERCKELQLQLQLKRLHAQNDRAVMSANPLTDQFCISKAISQFKQDTKYAIKLNTLVESLNYLFWHANIKTKLIDAQCWVILKDKQVKSPDENLK
ncbi:hypothetical protein ACO22_07787, partial [Paracoccidioides brasiliensis]